MKKLGDHKANVLRVLIAKGVMGFSTQQFHAEPENFGTNWSARLRELSKDYVIDRVKHVNHRGVTYVFSHKRTKADPVTKRKVMAFNKSNADGLAVRVKFEGGRVLLYSKHYKFLVPIAGKLKQMEMEL